MQAIMETLFDTVYLISVMTIGIRMIWDGRGSRPFFLFGVMAVVLGTGDASHLVPGHTLFVLRASRPIRPFWAWERGSPLSP